MVGLGLVAGCDKDDAGDTRADAPDTDSGTDSDTDAVEPESCATQEDSRECEAGGVQFCDQGQWGPCVQTAACMPGDNQGCTVCVGGEGGSDSGGGEECWEAQDTCVLEDGVPDWYCELNPESEACPCWTPLVLSFDRAEPRYESVPTAAFDLAVAGGCLDTDWPTSSTPWLARDLDGDGAIVDGRELFGSGTRLATGTRAPNGFAALAELDEDRNGRIDVRDPAFAELVLWSDDDRDKRGTSTELRSLHELRVLSLELEYAVDRRCDGRGNCGVERASFTFVGPGGAIEQGAVIDVHLSCQ